ncbi:MAG: hypothetical protein V3S68_05830 [Dehalococcoidia bacterium]
MVAARTRKEPARCPRDRLAAVALSASLAVSAGAVAAAAVWPQASWLAWGALLPLFLAIRMLDPARAAIAGATWGLYVYLFSLLGLGASISPTLSSLVLLAAVPGAYAGLGSLLTRAIGFNPFVLAVGWLLVEIGLKPLGLDHGLLAGVQTEAANLHWFARLLGYVFVGSIVALVNASLLVLLISCARLGVAYKGVFVGLPKPPASPSPAISPHIQLLGLCQAYPRAPPIAVHIPN